LQEFFMIWSRVKSLVRRDAGLRQPKRKPDRRSFSVEFLEDRCVPNGTFTVTNLSGNAAVAGSLPYEVNAADNAGGSNSVVFSHGLSGTVQLNNSLAVKNGVTVDGAGAQITISGPTNNTPAVQVAGTVTLNDLTIINGQAGGIIANGNLTLTNSTVALNTNNNAGGGGIINVGVLNMTNDTVTQNSAPLQKGGGIFNASGASATIINCTIANNSVNGGDGGGIYNQNGGTLNLLNTILYNPHSNAASAPDVLGAITNGQSNEFFQTGASFVHDLGGELYNSNPNFGPFGSHGGPTPTLVPGNSVNGVNSSAIGSVPGADQRGVARSGSVQIGSVQVQSSTGGGGGSNGSGGTTTGPTLHTPPFLAFLDQIFHATEAVNSNGTETMTESFFGFPLFVSTYDSNGNLISVTLDGLNFTFLFK
jgi:hypothetical protein